MNTDDFSFAIETVNRQSEFKKGIGVLGEKTLHAVLKLYMNRHSENHEVRIGPYIADIVDENGIIEIQTQGFNQIRKKLEVFLSVANVTLVYPIPRKRWIAWIDPDTGETSGQRKSPKTGNFYHAFYELYKIKSLLVNPNLNILLLLVDIEEYRNLDGWSHDKKRGSTRSERIPVALAGEMHIGGGIGYHPLVPEGLPAVFTSKDYKKAAGLALHDAQTALNVLHHVGAVERVGKKGNLYLYEKRNGDFL